MHVKFLLSLQANGLVNQSQTQRNTNITRNNANESHKEIQDTNNTNTNNQVRTEASNETTAQKYEPLAH